MILFILTMILLVFKKLKADLIPHYRSKNWEVCNIFLNLGIKEKRRYFSKSDEIYL